MARIGWDDLRFDTEEATDLLRLLTGKNPGAQSAVSLIAATQGWVAGLILSADGAMISEPRGLSLDEARAEHIFDFFASEVLRKADAVERDLLLTTSFLPTITPKTAEALTGNRCAGGLIAALNRRNFFTVRRPPGLIYEYHPLFRRFLQQKAKELYSADTLTEIRSAAITVLVDAGELGDAVALIREVGDWAQLTGLLESHALRLLTQARHRTLESWIAPFARSGLGAKPLATFLARRGPGTDSTKSGATGIGVRVPTFRER